MSMPNPDLRYGFENREPLGEGQHIYGLDLERLVNERLSIRVRGDDPDACSTGCKTIPRR
jgi:hypothetical protein